MSAVVDILRATQQISRGQDWFGADADWGVGLLDVVHIGATWRI